MHAQVPGIYNSALRAERGSATQPLLKGSLRPLLRGSPAVRDRPELCFGLTGWGLPASRGRSHSSGSKIRPSSCRALLAAACSLGSWKGKRPPPAGPGSPSGTGALW